MRDIIYDCKSNSEMGDSSDSEMGDSSDSEMGDAPPPASSKPARVKSKGWCCFFCPPVPPIDGGKDSGHGSPAHPSLASSRRKVEMIVQVKNKDKDVVVEVGEIVTLVEQCEAKEGDKEPTFLIKKKDGHKYKVKDSYFKEWVDLDEAAAKIQARFRGMQTRMEIHNRKKKGVGI